MTGAGFAPAGTSPAGSGFVAASLGVTGKALRDARGRQYGGRYIDPATRQYVFDEHGRYVGMNNVAQLVALAFLTVRNSSAVPDLGLEAPSGVIGQNFAQRRQEDIRQALAPITRSGLAELISIDVDVSRRPVVTLVRWRDLSTFEEQESRL